MTNRSTGRAVIDLISDVGESFGSWTMGDDAAMPDRHPARTWPWSRPRAEAGVKVRTGGSETEVLWDKYRFLCAAALLTSWARAPIGEAGSRDSEVTAGLLAEIAALATADGVPTAPDDIDAALRRMPATMRTSLHAEVEAGRAGELEHLGGHLLVLGERYGVDTSAARAIMADLRARVEPR